MEEIFGYFDYFSIACNVPTVYLDIDFFFALDLWGFINMKAQGFLDIGKLSFIISSFSFF